MTAISQRVVMIQPGPSTPVPAGTEGTMLAFNVAREAWEVEWDNGVSTFFPSEAGREEIGTLPPPGSTGVCDFCYHPEPRWEHRADDAPTDAHLIGETLVVGRSAGGGWAACNVCHALIERRDADRLAVRSAKRFKRRHPEVDMSQRELLRSIKQVQATYWNNAVGPGIRIDPEREIE